MVDEVGLGVVDAWEKKAFIEGAGGWVGVGEGQRAQQDRGLPFLREPSAVSGSGRRRAPTRRPRESESKRGKCSRVIIVSLAGGRHKNKIAVIVYN